MDVAQRSFTLKEPSWILSAVSWFSDTCAQTSYSQYPRDLVPVKSSVWAASLPTVSSLKRWSLLKNLRWHLSCTECHKKIWLWEFPLIKYILILHVKVLMSRPGFPTTHRKSIVSQSLHHLKLTLPGKTVFQRPSSAVISDTYHPLHMGKGYLLFCSSPSLFVPTPLYLFCHSFAWVLL